MSSIKVSELPVASQPFNGSEYVLGTQNGNSVKIPASTGGITPYATVGDIPTPYTGVAKVGHSLYTGNGDVPLEIPSLNSNNELVANIVPRTDTLDNLLTIIGSAGELASATDQAAIVKYNGTTAGGDIFYSNDDSLTALINYSLNTINGLSGYSSLLAVPPSNMPFGDDASGFIVYQIAASRLALSFDYGKNFSVMATPVATSFYVVSGGNNGMSLIVVGSPSTAYYTANNTPYSTQLTADTSGYNTPIVCSYQRAIIAGLSNDSYAVFTIGTNVLNNYTLPTGWTSLTLANIFSNQNLTSIASPCVIDDTSLSTSTPIFALMMKQNPTTSEVTDVLFIYGNGSTTTNVTLPTTLIDSSGFFYSGFTSYNFVICGKSNVAYVGSYKRNSTAPGAMTKIILPGMSNPLARVVGLNANPYNFYLTIDNGAGVRILYTSPNGFTWSILRNSSLHLNSSTNLVVLESGVLLQNVSMPSVFYYNRNNYSLLPPISLSFGSTIVSRNQIITLGTNQTTTKLFSINGVPEKTRTVVQNIPLTNTTVSLSRLTEYNINPAATISTLTLNFPTFPYDGQEVKCCFYTPSATGGIVITTLTYAVLTAGGMSSTVMGATTYAISSVPQYAVHTFRFNFSANNWVKI